MVILFTPEAYSDIENIVHLDNILSKKIVHMIKEIIQSPIEGIGNPRPLKYELGEYWSRKIDTNNRLIYKVASNEILFISCKSHK